MLIAKRNINISDNPMSIAQALKHEYAESFMAAFADEISSPQDMKTFERTIWVIDHGKNCLR